MTGLDVSTLGLLAVVAISYFVFNNTFLILHFGVVIYSILMVQVLYGEIRRQPFTAQHAKQMYPSDRWHTQAFFKGNRFLSRLWGAIFVVSILMVVFGTDTLMLLILPNALMILELVIGPSIGHRYSMRLLTKAHSANERAGNRERTSDIPK